MWGRGLALRAQRHDRRAARRQTAPLRATPSPKVARLLKRVERLAELPPAEQRAVLKVVDGFLDAHTTARPRRRASRAPHAAKEEARSGHTLTGLLHHGLHLRGSQTQGGFVNQLSAALLLPRFDRSQHPRRSLSQPRRPADLSIVPPTERSEHFDLESTMAKGPADIIEDSLSLRWIERLPGCVVGPSINRSSVHDDPRWPREQLGVDANALPVLAVEQACRAKDLNREPLVTIYHVWARRCKHDSSGGTSAYCTIW